MTSKHGGEHYDPDGCFGCKILTVGFQPSAFITRSPMVAQQVGRERELVQDLDAYKRLRQDGLQPKATSGAANLEKKADIEFEVVSGQLAETKAKGADATRGGKDWKRRTNDAFSASQRGEMLVQS